MNTSSLVKRAAVSALGVYLYISLVTLVMSNAEKLFGSQESGWLGPTLFLTLFIVSACTTGTMVLLKPITLYADGQKKEALHLFGYTVIALAVIALVVGIILVTTSLGINGR
jgi:heme O synthase-like polyprenyltransferase